MRGSAIIRENTGSIVVSLSLDGSANAIVNQGGGTVTAGQWHHFALCCADVGGGKKSYKLFLDGGVVFSDETLSAYPHENTTDLEFGATGEGSNKYGLNGYMDDLRITMGIARYSDPFVPPGPHASSRAIVDWGDKVNLQFGASEMEDGNDADLS